MFRTILFSLFFVSVSLPAQAQEDEHVRGTILSAYESVGTFATLDMGLQLSMDDHWYTYWRTPGDAGLSPAMDWSGSENVESVKVLWPAPKRFSALDMYSFGYDGTVVLPLGVTPKKTADAVTLKLKLDIVVCHEICIPQTILLEKSLPEGPAGKSADRIILTKAKAALPSHENTRDLSIDTAILSKDAVTVIVESKKGLVEGADMFIESHDMVLTAVPEIMSEDEGKKAVIKVKGPDGIDLTSHLLGKTVTIVLTNGDQAIERDFSF